MSYLELVSPAFLGNTPVLLAWLLGIVFGVRMVRQGGGKAEKLFLTGCSLMFVIQLVSPFLSGLARWLIFEQGMSRARAAGLVSSLPIGILGLAATVCLVYAFWLRFRARAKAPSEERSQCNGNFFHIPQRTYWYCPFPSSLDCGYRPSFSDAAA